MEIASNFTDLRAPISAIQKNFSAKGKTLHEERNIIKQFEIGGDSIIVKCFKPPSFLQGWIYAHWRASKAQRSFEYAQRLQALGINTHTPIGYFTKIVKSRLTESYFFSLLIDHDFTIRDILNQGEEADLDIIKSFTEFTFFLHQKNILHLDHSPGNTLVRKIDGDYNFSIIDINRMQFRKVSLKDGIKNFSKLSGDKRILEEIARTYANLAGADPKHCYDLLKKHQLKDSNARRRKRRIKNIIGRG